MTDQPPLPAQDPLPHLPATGEELLAEPEQGRENRVPTVERVDVRWLDQLTVEYDDDRT